jgi:hypothetical protein
MEPTDDFTPIEQEFLRQVRAREDAKSEEADRLLIYEIEVRLVIMGHPINR